MNNDFVISTDEFLKNIGWEIEWADAEGMRLHNYKLGMCVVLEPRMVSIMKILKGDDE